MKILSSALSNQPVDTTRAVTITNDYPSTFRKLTHKSPACGNISVPFLGAPLSFWSCIAA
jgi:hypothetical protein